MPLTRDETRGSGLAVAIDLVNTWDELEPEPDLIEGLEDVRTWLEWHGLSAAAKRVGETDVDRVRALRARFDRVFDAGGEDAAASLLNELVREHGTPPMLERGPAAAGASGRGRTSAKACRRSRRTRPRDCSPPSRSSAGHASAAAPAPRAAVRMSTAAGTGHAATAAPSAPTVSPRRSTARADGRRPAPRGQGRDAGARGARRVPRRSPGTGSGPGARSTSRSRAACSRRADRRCRRACRRRRRSSPGRERSGGRRCR